MNKWMGSKGEGYVVIQGIIFALIYFAPDKLFPSYVWPPLLASAATLIGLVGIAYGVAMITMGLLNLGMNLTAVPRPKEGASMVEKGAYKVVRHPIYSGIIVGALGLGLYRNGGLTILLALVLFAFFEWKTGPEERWLAEKYPSYPAYKLRVKKFIPWVY